MGSKPEDDETPEKQKPPIDDRLPQKPEVNPYEETRLSGKVYIDERGPLKPQKNPWDSDTDNDDEYPQDIIKPPKEDDGITYQGKIQIEDDKEDEIPTGEDEFQGEIQIIEDSDTKNAHAKYNVNIEYNCPVKWKSLNLTDQKNIRYCSKCNEKVYFVDSMEDYRNLPTESVCKTIGPKLLKAIGP